jgi:ADP-heptose:LPS heptosyltransferase
MTTDNNEVFAGLESARSNSEFSDEMHSRAGAKDASWALTQPDYLWSASTSETIPAAPSYPVAIFNQANEHRITNLLPDVHKIMVVLDLELKDMLLALPALDTLRLTYPQAEICMVGLPWHTQFWHGRPGPVDRVIQLPYAPSAEELTPEEEQAAEQFWADLVDDEFDLVLQLGSRPIEHAPSLRRLGARVTAGFRSFNSPMLDRWVPYAYYQPDVLRYLEAVSLVGAQPLSLEARLIITEADCAEIGWLDLDHRRPLAVLVPNAADSRRCWPVDKFAAVADGLARQGVRVALAGMAEDAIVVCQVAAACSSPVENLCGQLSLRGLTALFSQAAVVVSNESGLLHLAEAAGAPTVGIFWCADMIASGPLTRSRHRPAVSWQVECPVCGMNSTRSACGHTDSFVDEVQVAEVLTSSIELLRGGDALTALGLAPGFRRG